MVSPEELTELLSMLGGQCDALTIALAAICESLPRNSETANSVRQRLEQAYSGNLHRSTNDPYFVGFEKAHDLLAKLLG